MKKTILIIVIMSIVSLTYKESIAQQDTVSVNILDKDGKEIDFSKGCSGGIPKNFKLDIVPTEDYMVFWQVEAIRGNITVSTYAGNGKNVNLANMAYKAASGDRVIFKIRRLSIKKNGKMTLVKFKPTFISIPIF